jgi:large subunit ribosomal protein L21
MKKYAIIQLAGKQYKVSEGDALEVNRLEAEANSALKVEDVLMVVDGEKVSIGTPIVPGASVTFNVVEHNKGEKIRVATYKAKSRYRRVKGHRQVLTQLQVTKITA